MQFHLRANDRNETLVFPRLLDKVASTPTHSLDRQFYVGPGGHHDHRDRGVERNDLRQEIEPFLAGSRVARIVQIDQHRVIRVAADSFGDLFGRADLVYSVSFGTQ